MSMKEVEVKILGINRKNVEQRLKKIGAKKLFDGMSHSLFYDYEDEQLRKLRQTLRLRQEGKTATLTFKQNLRNGPGRVFKEHKIVVSDFAAAKALLESLGCTPWWVMKKHRVMYGVKGCIIQIDKHLDAHRFIPVFLEIKSAALPKIYALAKKLGFRKDDCKPWSISDVAEHYGEGGRA